VDPHILREVGTVAVALQGVGAVRGALARGMMSHLRAGTVFRAFAYSLHEQGVSFEGLGSAKRADIEVELMCNNRKGPVAMLTVSSRCSDAMLVAVHRTSGLALVVIKKDGADRSTVKLMSRKLVEITDLFYVDMIEAAYTDSKGISSLSRGEHGSAPFTNGGSGKPLFGFEIDRCRHV